MASRSFCFRSLLPMLAGLLLVAGAGPVAAADLLSAQKIVEGVTRPTALVFPPLADGRMYVLEKNGAMRIVHSDGGAWILQATPALTLPVATDNEAGLIGLACHPDFASNRLFYIVFSDRGVNQADGQYNDDLFVLRRYRMNATYDQVEAGSGVDLLVLPHNTERHYGGWIGFNPRDANDPVRRHHLYVAIGDRSIGEQSQNTATLHGSILRLDLNPVQYGNPGAPYGIPADNPTLPGVGARREIIAIGLRNPWRCSFDRITGDLWIGDVGDGRREEVSRLPYGTSGQNFGWPYREGFDTNNPGTPVIPMTDPVKDWSRGAAIGGYVYRGTALTGWQETYIYADYGGAGTIRSFRYSNGQVSEVNDQLKTQLQSKLGHGIGALAALGEDQAGELYLAEHHAGRLYRIVLDTDQVAPTITSTYPSVASVGFAWTYDAQATANPAATWMLENAPAGMTVVATTGLVQWTPTAEGVATARLRATNVAGAAIQDLVIDVRGLRNPENPPTANLANGLDYAYSEFSESAIVTQLNDVAFLPALRAGIAPRPSIATTVLPGRSADRFYVRFTGYIQVPVDGLYTFFTQSDDGSRLLIGDDLVVDNDGLHGLDERQESVALAAGLHRITIEYFELAGGENLLVSWQPPGAAKAVIPDSAFHRFSDPHGLDSYAGITPYLNMPSSPTGAMPAKLSQTGAFADVATLRPVTGVIPYDVNSPLWSDGSAKWRWLALPRGTQMGFSATGNWIFPPGTVFVKHFELGGRRLETRLLVVTAQEAYGVTYRWTSATDADLLLGDEPLDEVIPLAGGATQTWTYPSRANCMQCHTGVAGFVLGARTHQLNGETTYPSTARSDNQLRTLAHVGALGGGGFQVSQIATYLKSVDVADTSAPLEHRVRSYLDANCMHCHQPGGPVSASFDTRLSTPLAQQGLIDAIPGHSLGIANARIVAMGDPGRSVLLARVNTVDPSIRMPILGRQDLHPAAITAITAWIQGTGTPNLPPTVSVAASETAITLPTNQVTLTGSATDPESRPLTYQWSVTSGIAANVGFATPTARTTTASFAAAGTYTLRLTVTDDLPQTAFAAVTIIVSPAPTGGWTVARAVDLGNAIGAPITTGGITWALDPGQPAGTARVEAPGDGDFAGTTTLDAIYRTNATGGSFTRTFTGLEPGTYRARILITEVWFNQAGSRIFSVLANGVTISSGIDPYALGGARWYASEVTTATFTPTSGTVELRFQASADQALVTAIVLERQGGETPPNAPPTVNVVASATALTLPTNQVTLTGSATDPEGRPLTYQWSVTSGVAGNVSFATPTGLTTTANFAAAGTYTLRLAVTDDLPQTAFASVTIVISPASTGGWTVARALDLGNAIGTPITAGGITWALDPGQAAGTARVEAPGDGDFAGTTTLDAIYRTNATGGTFTRTFTGLEPGTYRARILTTEVWFNQAGSRIFSVLANGVTVSSGIDPYALGGARWYASEVTTATFTPSSGAVELRFQASSDQALVTAILLERQGGEAPPNAPPTVNVVASATTITLPTNQVTLTGSATDPEGRSLTYQWSVTSGASTHVSFAAPTALVTGVTFAAAGTYTLRLAATDDLAQTAFALVTVVVAPAPTGPAIQITFQPEVTPVPAGWLADGGGPFAARNGLTYGWDADIPGETRRRNAIADPIRDTLIHVARGTARTWEIALPNGLYAVELQAGDPSFQDSINTLLVEGVLCVDPTPNVGHADTFTVEVTVSDGRLTIGQGSGGANAKLQSVVIMAMPAGNG